MDMGKIEDWLSTIPSKYTRKSYKHGVQKFEEFYTKTRIDNLQNVMKELEDKVTKYGEWLTNWIEFSNYTEEEKQAIRRKLNLREYSEEEKEMMKLFVATARELEEENGMVDAKKLDREFKARLKRRLKKDDH